MWLFIHASNLLPLNSPSPLPYTNKIVKHRLTRTAAVLRPISILSQVGLCPSLLRLFLDCCNCCRVAAKGKGGGGGERELELKPENFLLQRGRGGRKGDQTRWRGRSVCPDCSGLVPFTMPCLFRILSSHCIYPQSGTTCRPSKYLTLFLVCFSAAAVGGEGGGGRWRRGRHGRSAMKRGQAISSGACYLYIFRHFFKVSEQYLGCMCQAWALNWWWSWCDSKFSLPTKTLKSAGVQSITLGDVTIGSST